MSENRVVVLREIETTAVSRSLVPKLKYYQGPNPRRCVMSRKYLYVLASVLLASTVAESVAEAGGYTVYIYNTRRPQQGWIRAGLVGQVYMPTSAQCRRAIETRVKENKKYRTDFEQFAIVYHNSRPPEGRLRNYVRFQLVYVPGRGFVASLDGSDAQPPALFDGRSEPLRLAVNEAHREDAASIRPRETSALARQNATHRFVGAA